MAHTRHPGRSIAVVVALTLLASIAPGTRAASPRPIRGARGMVSAPEPQAAQAGLDVLRRGGTAVDAAVAVALALAVTHPYAGNLAGGGFLLYRTPDGKAFALDFRETAPAALRAEMFLDSHGDAVRERALRGGLAVGVPGSVAGLYDAHRRWGRLPWRDLVAPAVRLAEDGFRVSERNAFYLERDGARLLLDRAAAAIFARDGKLLREGDLLVQKDLARTLRRIAERGPEGFYQGSVAEALVGAVKRRGGVMEMTDLAGYAPILREPLEGRYRGRRILTFPPPSSGGIALLQILAMLERYDLAASGPGSSLTVHRVAEAERRAFADRSRWMGDPGFFAVPARGLLDPAYVAARAGTIRDDVATPSTEIRPGSPAGEPEHTLHFSVADAEGAVASLTTTLNSGFGACAVAEGTGMLLNNEIDDFALAEGLPNQFGLLGSKANAPEPGKRPLSSMTPTIVEGATPGARPAVVLGAPGGPTIITTVLQILVNVVDHGMNLQEAINAPRFHHQWQPDRIDHEAGAFPADVADALTRRGHVLHERTFIGNACVLGSDPVTGNWIGAADPRGEGAALGY